MSLQLFRTHLAQFALAALALTLLAVPVQATLIGNPPVPQSNGTDGATTVMQVYFNSPVPAGYAYITNFETYYQGQGGNFDAIVLQPLGADQYKVIYENNFTVTPLSLPGVETFPVAPILVQPGDLIAHYGTGIPFTDGSLGGTFQQIFYSSPNPPTLNSVITLPGASFPQGGANGTYIRDYSFAANVITPEPASFVLFGLGALGLFFAVRRRGNA